MAARLSALLASRTLPPGFFIFLKIPGTHFCYSLSRHQGPVWLEGLGKFKKSTSSGFEPATFRLAA
jgi:hypothetical protein